MRNSNGFAPVVILLIVVVIALAGVAYMTGTNRLLTNTVVSPSPVPVFSFSPTPKPTLSPTSDPTADWKVYKDTKVGIEFKYPDTWYAKAYTASNSFFNVFLDSKPIVFPEASSFVTPIHIGFNEVTDANTNMPYILETNIEKTSERISSVLDPRSLTIDRNLTVGGKKAFRITGVSVPGDMLEGQHFDETLIQLNGKVLVVTLYNNQNFSSIYTKIVSSLKFSE